MHARLPASRKPDLAPAGLCHWSKTCLANEIAFPGTKRFFAVYILALRTSQTQYTVSLSELRVLVQALAD